MGARHALLQSGGTWVAPAPPHASPPLPCCPPCPASAPAPAPGSTSSCPTTAAWRGMWTPGAAGAFRPAPPSTRRWWRRSAPRLAPRCARPPLTRGSPLSAETPSAARQVGGVFTRGCKCTQHKRQGRGVRANACRCTVAHSLRGTHQTCPSTRASTPAGADTRVARGRDGRPSIAGLHQRRQLWGGGGGRRPLVLHLAPAGGDGWAREAAAQPAPGCGGAGAVAAATAAAPGSVDKLTQWMQPQLWPPTALEPGTCVTTSDRE